MISSQRVHFCQRNWLITMTNRDNSKARYYFTNERLRRLCRFTQKIESVKKAKEDSEAKQEKQKEVSEALKSTFEYSGDENPPPTGAPGMGRGKT